MPITEITRPRRLLVVGGSDSGTLSLVARLTGSTPLQPDSASTAGLSHIWDVRTAYYTAKVPIWIDEIADLGRWRDDFLQSEAKEVVDALGAWAFVFRQPLDTAGIALAERTVEAIQGIIYTHCGHAWDGVCLAIGMPNSLSGDTILTPDDLYDMFAGHGFEYVDSAETGRNEFGEMRGLGRVQEALEANEWREITDDLPSDGLEEDLEYDRALLGGSQLSWEEVQARFAGVDAPQDSEDSRVGTSEDEEQVNYLEEIVSRLRATKGSMVPSCGLWRCSSGQQS